MRNHFIISVDNATCAALAAPFGLPSDGGAAPAPRCVQPYAGYGAASANTSVDGAAGYRSHNFNAIMIHRVAWNLYLLRRGWAVMHCDLDIVWLHDPRPVFATPEYRHSDMLLQSEQVYGYNGGFYLARARPSVRAGVTYWMNDLVHTWETQHGQGGRAAAQLWHQQLFRARLEVCGRCAHPGGKPRHPRCQQSRGHPAR